MNFPWRGNQGHIWQPSAVITSEQRPRKTHGSQREPNPARLAVLAGASLVGDSNKCIETQEKQQSADESAPRFTPSGPRTRVGTGPTLGVAQSAAAGGGTGADAVAEVSARPGEALNRDLTAPT